MQTIRLGSVGPEVQAWQRAIGVVADGVFGPSTRAMTVAFQTTHHLIADGIVGPATWRAAGLVPPAVVLEGVDLSPAQAGARVDFDKLFAAGVRFVVVRTQAGESVADATTKPFLEGARRAGHAVSVYQYALPDEDPADDVDALLRAIGDHELDFPAWLDLETLNGRSASQVLDWSGGWVERYRAARGHHPTIYSGKGFWSSLGPAGLAAPALEVFDGCECVSAAYGAATPPAYGPFPSPRFHQYAGNLIARITRPFVWQGKAYKLGEHVWGSVARAAIAATAAERIAAPGIVDGVDGEVDRDHFFGTLDDLKSLTAPPIVA